MLLSQFFQVRFVSVVTAIGMNGKDSLLDLVLFQYWNGTWRLADSL